MRWQLRFVLVLVAGPLPAAAREDALRVRSAALFTDAVRAELGQIQAEGLGVAAPRMSNLTLAGRANRPADVWTLTR